MENIKTSKPRLFLISEYVRTEYDVIDEDLFKELLKKGDIIPI